MKNPHKIIRLRILAGALLVGLPGLILGTNRTVMHIIEMAAEMDFHPLCLTHWLMLLTRI